MKGKPKKKLDPETKDFLKKIGKRMVKRRKELGYGNSDDFAYDKGINRSQYGKYEAGGQNMRVSSLLKTLNSLGFTVEQFFGDISNHQK